MPSPGGAVPRSAFDVARKQPHHLVAAVVDDVRGPAAWRILSREDAVVFAVAAVRSDVAVSDGQSCFRPHPAPIHVDPARAVLEHVFRDGAAERLAGHDDRLPGGLQRRAPAGPPAGRVGGGGGDVQHGGTAVIVLAWCYGEQAPVAFADFLAVGLGYSFSVDREFGPVSHNRGHDYRRRKLLSSGSAFVPRPKCRAATIEAVCLCDGNAARYSSGLYRRSDLGGKARSSASLVYRLAHIVRLRKPAAVDPHHAVPNLPACVLDGTREPVVRARAAEREQVRAGFGDSERLGPELFAGHAVIPTLAHERQPVGRIAHDAINALGVERLHHFAAVAVVDVPRHARSVSSPSNESISLFARLSIPSS